MRRIVIGVDGSASATEALRWSSRLATRQRAELVVVTAMIPTSSEMRRHASLLAQHERRLQAWCDGADLDDVRVRLVVEPDDPRAALLSVAEREEADLIVVGRIGSSRGPGPLHLGSTVEWLAHHSDIPLAVIGERRRMATHRVLIGVDGSPGSQAAIRWVRDWQSSPDIRVIAATVDDPYPEQTTLDKHATWARDLESRIRDDFATELFDSDSIVTPKALCGANAAAALLRYADEVDVDLVVVGTKALGGFTGRRIGGPAMAILHRTVHSLVVVPPPPGELD